MVNGLHVGTGFDGYEQESMLLLDCVMSVRDLLKCSGITIWVYTLVVVCL